MSYLPQFKNDIFISYAHIDNIALGDSKGWVTNFHRALEVRLGQLMGLPPRIWRDPKLDQDKAEGVIPLRSISELHGAAVLVCVLSPGYLRSERCFWELQEYVKHHSHANLDPLIFTVVTSPTRLEQQPSELATQLAYEFYELDPASGRVHGFMELFGPEAQTRFWMRLDDVAHDIVTALEQLQERIAGKKVQPLAIPKTEAFKISESSGNSRALRVFLCHASQDKSRVRDLYRILTGTGVDAWLDEEKLIPGQLWESEIRKALRRSDAVVVCLSHAALTKTGYIQKEIRQVLDVADEHPEGAVFLIPARFEDCEVPERFSNRHWVNLFEERGKEFLMRALELRASQLIAENPRYSI